MSYNQSQLKASSPQMRLLLHKQSELNNIDRSAEEIGTILTKIVHLAKEEKNGFVYCHAMMEMLFFQQQFGDPMKGLHYGEMFLRDGQELMDAVMGTTSQPNVMRSSYLLTLNILGELYIEYYQVDAQKLEAFFDHYWNMAHEIGQELYYWHCRLKAALQNNDLTKAMHYFANFERTRKPSIGCYVCESRMVQKYHVLAGDFETAMEMAEDFIAGKSLQQQRNFPRCAICNAHAQYNLLFEYCLATNQPAFLLQIAPLYQRVASSEDQITVGLVLRALYHDFANLEDVAAYAVQLLSRKTTPWMKLKNCLCQSIYFELLHQNGVETITLKAKSALPIPALEEELYSTSELATYCQTQADKIGAAFDESRPGFDYPKRRKTYHDLLNIKLTALHHEKR